jgi:excisionase family DNA binding protein
MNSNPMREADLSEEFGPPVRDSGAGLLSRTKPWLSLSADGQTWRAAATVTVTEAASILGVGRNTAYDSIRRGDLPAIRLGHRVLVPVARLRRLLGEVYEEAPVGAVAGSREPSR